MWKPFETRLELHTSQVDISAACWVHVKYIAQVIIAFLVAALSGQKEWKIHNFN
jgi:hypothetical protein